MEICACPAPASLSAIIRRLCKENFGQIQRFLIQRAGYTFDNTPDPGPEIDIKELASWTPLFASATGTKVVSTPYIENFIIPRTEMASEGGGDNTTIDGIEYVVGGNAVRGIGQIAEQPSLTIMEVRKLMCESDLVWYGLTNSGGIIAQDLDPIEDPGVKFTGVSMQSLFVSDADNNGLNTRDKADFSFGLAYGWRDGVTVVKPNFNVKTQLWPA